MTFNPYEAPEASLLPEREKPDYDQIKSSLRIPAISLIVLSSIAILLDVAILRNAIVDDAPKMLSEEGPDMGWALIIGNVVANAGLLIIHAIVLFGSVQMMRVRSYPGAQAAAIVSLIPFCSPVLLLGFPFGIWAFVVLRREGVAVVFRQQANSAYRKNAQREN